jgi:hypothetical protein
MASTSAFELGGSLVFLRMRGVGVVTGSSLVTISAHSSGVGVSTAASWLRKRLTAASAAACSPGRTCG